MSQTPPFFPSSLFLSHHENPKIGLGGLVELDKALIWNTDDHLLPSLQVHHPTQEAAVPPHVGAVCLCKGDRWLTSSSSSSG
jgi:hypothetical protein